ncbi:MAG: acyltransferase [Oscillospiraceae bacterium]|nr:acyltransferase [Oscillospiraceae bacterium]MBQ9929654.1 acyltransferase [Oscillospiraceae bacterium]
MTKTVKPQYGMLDIAKFLCALLILFYHFFSENGSVPAILEEALSTYAIAVALFMTISGFLLFRKLESVPTRQERWQVVRKQAWRTLRIYLLWSIVYIAYNISRWDFANLTVIFVLRQLQMWVFSSTFYTIWFMPALAIGVVATFWLTELLPKWAQAVLGAVLYIAGALMLTYKGVGAMIPGYAAVTDFAGMWLGGARGWLLYAIPLLLVGRLVAQKEEKANQRWGLWLILSVACVAVLLAEALTLRHFFGSTGIDMTLLMPATVFCILNFLLCIQIPQGAYQLWMRKMSVLIFVTQRIFLSVIPKLVGESMLANGYFAFLFCVGGTIAFSAAIVFFSRKVKLLKLLY